LGAWLTFYGKSGRTFQRASMLWEKTMPLNSKNNGGHFNPTIIKPKEKGFSL
jgi:hypothetical protein